MRVTPTSIALRWLFPPAFTRKLHDLRREFNRADADGSGFLSREELAALLDDRHPDMLSFLQQVAAAAAGAGSARGALVPAASRSQSSDWAP